MRPISISILLVWKSAICFTVLSVHSIRLNSTNTAWVLPCATVLRIQRCSQQGHPPPRPLCPSKHTGGETLYYSFIKQAFVRWLPCALVSISNSAFLPVFSFNATDRDSCSLCYVWCDFVNNYSWPLNNRGLNCTGPLKYTGFVLNFIDK